MRSLAARAAALRTWLLLTAAYVLAAGPAWALARLGGGALGRPGWRVPRPPRLRSPG